MNTEPAHSIPRRPPGEPAPLTPNQHQIWFLEQMHPLAAAYNVAEATKIRGPLDVAALQGALQDVVARHEILRSVIESRQGRPVQVVREAGAFSLPVDDLRAGPDSERTSRGLRAAAEEAARRFDLARGPLFRARLLRLRDDEHWLVLAAHHTVTDGWSADLVRLEIAEFYRARTTGAPPDLAQLPIQFGDYATWLERDLRRSLPEHIEFWRRHLAGAPELIELPTDRPRPVVSTQRGDRCAMLLPAELWDNLQAFARAEGATLFMALQAAVQVLLARYTGQQDFVIGTPTAGRGRPELNDVVGYFVNMLPLRADLRGDPTFRELLQRVKRVTLDGLEHQEVPFERLVHELRPARSTSYNPLFQVTIILEQDENRSWKLPGLEIGSVPLLLPTAKFDLTFLFRREIDGPHAVIEFSADLFTEATIARMLAHLKILLGNIVRQPDAPVSLLEMMDEAERAGILARSRSALSALPPATCIHRRVEAQAARQPNAVAVTCGGEHLTYGELNERANRLAHHLRALGIGPDQLVAVCLERSLDMIVALLAILKAGGAYVPLDPIHPPERIALLLEDARAPVIVTTRALADRLPPHNARSVCLDADAAAFARQAAHNPEAGVQPHHLAYVIYTSGSTGKPKGVLVTHHNVVRLFDATADWYHFGPSDVWPLFHSFAFDVSVWEIWGALTHGGRLVVVPHLVTRSPDDFWNLLRAEGVTVLNQTPSAFRQLLVAACARPAPIPALRTIIFAGEALEIASLRPWFERYGDARPQLVNMYGITETTVHVTYRPITRNDLAGGSVIGRPIPDLSLHLLDEQRRPVPIGIPGEIWVGGAGVARGYLERPELTAAKFVDDPFSSQPGAKLYRSGDRARWLENGDLEYLGRIDDQVKIRGFRIEPGEIDAVLRDHPAIRDCAVVARRSENGIRLVAYCVLQESPAVSDKALREHLRARLPEYMIPAALVRLDRLPLTANGKIDRRALPEPTTDTAGADREYVAPTTELEQRIASVWQEVLQLERVGIRDNFFDVGGNSMSLVEVRNRLQPKLPGGVSVLSLFQYPTIEALAHHLTAETAPTTTDDPIARRARRQREALARARAGSPNSPSSR